MTLTHHPDCWFWLDNHADDCNCGLTGEADAGMRPWSQAAFAEWRAAVLTMQRKRGIDV